jgi:hypothetical protein
MIEDYLEPDAVEMQRSRCVPIRARSDFLPSVVQFWDAQESERTVQFELPLAVTAQISPAVPPITEGQTTPSPTPERVADAVIRFPRTPEPCAKPSLKPPQQFRRRKERFTVGGFLVGCAMGSAAAALVLLVVQTVVG